MRLIRANAAHEVDPPGRPGWLPPAARIGLIAIAGVAGVLVVAAIAVVIVLLTGPTELGFVRDRYQAALQEQLGADYAVTVDKAVVDVDPALGLVVEISNTEVDDANGTPVVSVPSTRLAIDPLALLRFRLSVGTVELSHPAIALVRPVAGRVYLGDAATPPPPGTTDNRVSLGKLRAANEDGGFPALARVLRFVDQGLGQALAGAVAADFTRLSVVNGTVIIWDAEALRQRRFADTDFNVAVDADNRSLTASVAASGYSGRWEAKLDRTIDSDAGTHTLAGEFSQVSLPDIFPQLAESGSLTTADLPLYGRLSITFGAKRRIEAAEVEVDVGAGVIRLGESQESVLLDEAALRLRWDVGSRAIVVEPSPIYFGQTRAIASGLIRREGGDGPPTYAVNLEARDAILAASDANELPLRADRLALAAAFSPEDQLVEIRDLSIQTDQGSLALAGSVGLEGSSPSLALAATISSMPVAAFKQMWIPFIAPGARRWVLSHITDGRIEAGEFQATVAAGLLGAEPVPPLPEDALRLNLRLENVSFHTFGELPPIDGAYGNAVLAGSTFGLDLEKAEVQVGSGETVRLEAGAFAIDDVFDPEAIGVVEVQLAGSAQALGRIADARPLEVLAKRDLAPEDLSGTVGATVSARIPLGLEEEDLEAALGWKVSLVGKGLASARPIEGRRFADADVTIVVTPDNVSVAGRATIDGVPADVSFSQPLGAGGQSAGRGQQLARLSLDQAARKKLGLGLDEIVDGTVGTQISGLTDGEGQHYDLDLSTARLRLPGVGWTKGIGVPATMSFDLIPIDVGYQVENIVFSGDGFGFNGTAVISHKDGLVSADITDFALRPGDSIGFSLIATPSGYAIKVAGKSFDVRGVITEATDAGGEDGGDAPDLTIEADVARVIGFNGQILENARAVFVSTKGEPTKIQVKGSLFGTALTVSYSDEPKAASLNVQADAGNFLRFLDLYTRIGGGELSIEAERRGRQDPLAGRLIIKDFEVLDEPAVQRAISNAPSRENIDTTRLRFERMMARFRVARDVIAIDEALIRGQSVGATFDGQIDLARSQVRINGTYIPVYAFNNVFGRVPLVGLVLGGGNREGLIGVTFRVEGALDGPKVYFNPLSAVAPGIFRKIFEFR